MINNDYRLITFYLRINVNKPMDIMQSGFYIFYLYEIIRRDLSDLITPADTSPINLSGFIVSNHTYNGMRSNISQESCIILAITETCVCNVLISV